MKGETHAYGQGKRLPNQVAGELHRTKGRAGAAQLRRWPHQQRRTPAQLRSGRTPNYACPLLKRTRRESTNVDDLCIAHNAGMYTLARGLRNAAKLIEVGKAGFELHEKKSMEWRESKISSTK
ncbi:hypothetical protein Fot_35205 [Forsythia ovata]|uniref:Uncharacterized protein n=1 Tax=Forsythia ovata TaxID=205694 RepID=A0ABD1SKV3_9LAMI